MPKGELIRVRVSTIPSTFLCIAPKLISYIYFTNSSEESKNKTPDYLYLFL